MTKELELQGELRKVDQLKHMLGDDTANLRLLLDTVEGQTNLLEMMDEIVHNIMANEDLEQQARDKVKEFEERANKRRVIVMQIMERIGLKTAKRPLYTASIADGPKSVHITDEALIPMHLHRVAPDKAAIAKVLKEGIEVDGAQLNNGPPVLRILR